MVKGLIPPRPYGHSPFVTSKWESYLPNNSSYSSGSITVLLFIEGREAKPRREFQETSAIYFQLPPPYGYCLRRSCLRSLCNHKQVCIALTYSQHSLCSRGRVLFERRSSHKYMLQSSIPTPPSKLSLFSKRGNAGERCLRQREL